VDEATGAVCVETLKRDWKKELTLRDVLVTISCLLIVPNPASALNAEAGRLSQEDWSSYERRARLMTSVHARVGPEMADAVRDAKMRGEEKEGGRRKGKGKEKADVEEMVEKKKRKSPRRDGEDGTAEDISMTDVKDFAMVPPTITPEKNSTGGNEHDAVQQPPTKRARALRMTDDNIFGIRMDGSQQQKKDSVSERTSTAMALETSPDSRRQVPITASSPWTPPPAAKITTTTPPSVLRTQTDAKELGVSNLNPFATPPNAFSKPQQPPPQLHFQTPPPRPNKTIKPAKAPGNHVTASFASSTHSPAPASSPDPFAFLWKWQVSAQPHLFTPSSSRVTGVTTRRRGKGKAVFCADAMTPTEIQKNKGSEKERQNEEMMRGCGHDIERWNKGDDGRPRVGLRRL
jgi:ubiquitin-conjugating enzyme E2 S